jgi:predicted permease
MADTTLQIQALAWVILWLSALFGLGVLLRWMKVMEDAAIDHINAFVFNCCLPAAVFKAIASTNLSKLNWIFIVAFLFLRVLYALIFWAFTEVQKGKLKHFIVHYMDTTWINTIIFGVPILSAIVGQELGLLYPVLASISSFFFQLPFLLICFELNEVKNPLARNQLPQTTPTPNPDPQNNKSEKKSSNRKCYECWNFCIAKKNSPSHDGKDVATRIVLRIISNPPIIGIVLGFCWSATGWAVHPILDGFVTNLANVITPASAFTVGMFLYRKDITRHWRWTVFYLCIKLIAVPLTMIPILYVLGIKGQAAQMAVVVSAFPIAISAFNLSKKYELGNYQTAGCIAFGTVLMLPFTIIWVLLVDKVFTFNY